MQFAEGESRNAPDTDREGRARDFDDLKNGKLSMPRGNSIVGALRVKYSLYEFFKCILNFSHVQFIKNTNFYAINELISVCISFSTVQYHLF